MVATQTHSHRRSFDARRCWSRISNGRWRCVGTRWGRSHLRQRRSDRRQRAPTGSLTQRHNCTVHPRKLFCCALSTVRAKVTSERPGVAGEARLPQVLRRRQGRLRRAAGFDSASPSHHCPAVPGGSARRLGAPPQHYRVAAHGSSRTSMGSLCSLKGANRCTRPPPGALARCWETRSLTRTATSWSSTRSRGERKADMLALR